MNEPMSDERLAEIDRMPLYTKEELVWQAVDDLYNEVIRLRALVGRTPLDTGEGESSPM